MALHLEVGSRCSVFYVTWFGSHGHKISGCELKLQIESFKFGTRALARNKTNHLVCINCILFMLIGSPFICHQWGILHRHGMPPTWEKVVTHLFKPLDFGNLRDGHDLSQLPLPNQIFRILSLCIDPTQGCQNCDRVHRDARWIGGLSHQSGNLSNLCNPLQKVVIHASSDTRFKWIR